MSSQDNDHFSGHADRYEAFRPTYPDALFVYLASLCTRRQFAWDCATGNGQAAAALAPYFSNVMATDLSQKQIDQARARENVQYRVAPADNAPIADASVDLVTVAQALHWFQLPRFYAEVRRVTSPDGVIAVWCYQLHTITPTVDAIVNHFYSRHRRGRLASRAPTGRGSLHDARISVRRIRPAAVPDGSSLGPEPGSGLPELVVGNTAVSEADSGADPLELIRDELATAWGDRDVPET